MSLNTWQETLLSHRGDGTALTAAAAASLLQGASASRAKYTFPANFFEVNRKIRVVATGRISCAVTTPGTARFDFRLGGSVVWDSLAINLNVVAKTNVHWHLEASLITQASGDGTTATLFPANCIFSSEALVGSPLPTAGGSGSVLLPYNTPPVVGAGFNSTVSQQFDLFFTQTVATGSCQLHTLCIESHN
jgi:hypothetical protein